MVANTVPMLRNSERHDFKRCVLRWHWRYREMLVPISLNTGPLVFGSLGHLALADYYQLGVKRGPHPAETWDEITKDLVDFVKTEAKYFDDEIEASWEDARELGRNMTITDLYELPLDDPKVFEAFRRGDVLGIFQFEGHTTKRVLKQVAPTKFMDLVDVNALSRPGGDDKAYLANKAQGLLGIAENHEILHEHLGWTHGTIVYQEQILQILRDLGNFEPAAVNSVRKAISAKKDATQFNVYREQFVDGAATHDMNSGEALDIWQLIVNASGYAFNISHAACYTDTAYRQMWLKVYHPEFYLGQLQKCPDDDEGKERRRRLIIEANQKGIHVFPPSLDVSQKNWSLHNGHLYAGLTAVKGIGDKVADSIVQWRDNTLRLELDWEALVEVPGIGEGRIQTIKDFVFHDDPFGVNKVRNALDIIRKDFDNDEFPGIDPPTHKSLDITEPNEFVVYMGVLKRKIYKNIIDTRQKYANTGAPNAEGVDARGLTREEIQATLTDPHLLDYAVLETVDEYDEPVRIRISRKKFPQYKGLISKARVNHDVILARGYISDYGGIAIQISDLVVIDPEG